MGSLNPFKEAADALENKSSLTNKKIIPPAKEEKAEPKREGGVERLVRESAEKYTLDKDRKLQDSYRERKGLDQSNRPTRKNSTRATGR